MSYSPGTSFAQTVRSPAPQTPGAGSSSESEDSGAEPGSPGNIPKRTRPEGALGEVELLLEGLAEDLNTLQLRAEYVRAPRHPDDLPLVQSSVRDVVEKLAALDDLAESLQDVWVPIEVIECIDDNRNPDEYTKEMLEMTAAENQFTNGKVHAVQSYLGLLATGLADAFPEMADLIHPPPLPLESNHRPDELQDNSIQPETVDNRPDNSLPVDVVMEGNMYIE